MAPDSDFEPARLDHLVAGNTGRMLDSRRTPFRIVAIREDVGRFDFELTAFEDAGRVWSYPLERHTRFQFPLVGTTLADADTLGRLQAAVARLDRPLAIAADADTRAATEARITAARSAARTFLAERSAFFGAGGSLSPLPDVGPEALAKDLRAYLDRRGGLASVEAAFADQYVSNPWASELVKGHRIVLAELGLCPFDGTIVRDPTLFDPPWDRDRRAAHIVERFAFVREVLAAAGLDKVTLYRGLGCSGPLETPRNVTFVSTTFSREVAASFFDYAQGDAPAVLYRQVVPPERVFMTYLETAEMNRQYEEVEAILLFEPGNLAF